MKLEEIHLRMIEGMDEAEKANFVAGLEALNMSNPADQVALREAFRRLCPDASERELDIMVAGETPQDNRKAWIA